MNYRSFIAVEIPTGIHRAIAHITQELQKELSRSMVRWVESENIHLTLKFLGDVPPGDLENLAGLLKAELAAHEPFTMSVKGLGAFPNQHRPRIIWVGLEAPVGLAKLQKAVETTAARLEFPAEERPFSPHLTIGRVNQHVSQSDLARIGPVLESTHFGSLGDVNVQAVRIFKSDLRPTGAVYTPMYALPMKSIHHVEN